jgi:hypothetical protein
MRGAEEDDETVETGVFTSNIKTGRMRGLISYLDDMIS